MSKAAASTLRETEHPREFRDNIYVYPVLSRRSGGVSIGINLNPDKACNFDCIYCQVDRTRAPSEYFVGLPALLGELEAILAGLHSPRSTPDSPQRAQRTQRTDEVDEAKEKSPSSASNAVEPPSPLRGGPAGRRRYGLLWDEPEFRHIPAEKRRVADVAFSGDGEPTTFKNFAEVVERCIEVKESAGFREPKVVLITNATGLDRPEVRRGLRFMDAHRGEVWAKLDAGTPEYFALIDKTQFPYERVLGNIAQCAREREIVIQSCFMRVHGAGPDAGEISAYVERLREIVRGGGRIRLVQVYTVARRPAYPIVSSLSDAEVDAIAQLVRGETGLAAGAYYGNIAPDKTNP